MKRLLQPLATGLFAIALTAGPVFAAQQQSAPPQQQSTTTTPQTTTPQTNTSTPATSQDKNTQPQQTQTQPGQTQAPSQPTINPNVPPPPPPGAQPTPGTDAKSGTTPAPAAAAAKPGDDAPVSQQAQPNVKQGTKQDVDAIGDRGVGKGVDFYSIEKEIALGKSLAQEVEKVSKLVDDPVIVEYVNRVGQNLVRNSDAKVPFTIKVIDSDEINAFALPGGFFYVNSGLILRASEEAELAGVMAHEISHVAARHGTKNETKGQIMQLAMIPLILLGPGGWAGYGIYEAAQFAIPMTYLKFTRDSEREADYLGVQYMYKAGYDPNAYVAFFEKILAEEKRQPGSIPKIFSTHPPTPERIANTQKEIATILPARDSYIVSTSEFDQVKARLMAYEHRNKVKTGKSGGPTLRTKTEQKKDPTANSPSTTSDGDDSDRPVLKKRDGSTQGNGNCPPNSTGTGTGTTTGTTTTGTSCGASSGTTIDHN